MKSSSRRFGAFPKRKAVFQTLRVPWEGQENSRLHENQHVGPHGKHLLKFAEVLSSAQVPLSSEKKKRLAPHEVFHAQALPSDLGAAHPS